MQLNANRFSSIHYCQHPAHSPFPPHPHNHSLPLPQPLHGVDQPFAPCSSKLLAVLHVVEHWILILDNPVFSGDNL